MCLRKPDWAASYAAGRSAKAAGPGCAPATGHGFAVFRRPWSRKLTMSVAGPGSSLPVVNGSFRLARLKLRSPCGQLQDLAGFFFGQLLH
jgi:hypothetical protein